MELSQIINIASYSEFRRINLKGGVMLFTSALSDEGKTFIAVDLAISEALKLGSDKAVLFVDLNSFNHEGSNILAKGSLMNKGIVDILLNKNSAEDCIQATEIDNLFLLPYGNPPPSFEPLQYLKPLGKLISEDLKNYTIFIDSVPVFLRNRGNFDPAEISQIADATYLVILAGKTPREVVLKSKEDIESFGGNIGGIIMNDLFVKPLRSEISFYLSLLEKIPILRSPLAYLRARIGIY